MVQYNNNRVAKNMDIERKSSWIMLYVKKYKCKFQI